MVNSVLSQVSGINSQMLQTHLLDNLRTERDRFVAFAFATADILVELDEHGVIQYIDGATRGLLGHSPEEMCGQSFYSYLSEEDALVARDALTGLRKKNRLERLAITLHSRHKDSLPFILSGFRLADAKNHSYISLSVMRDSLSPNQLTRRDYETGLLKTHGFVESAAKELEVARENGEKLEITLLDFPDIKSFLDQLDPEAAEKLLLEISDYMRNKSIGGDMAGMLNDEAFGLMHSADVNPAEVIQGIISITQKADPKGRGMAVTAQTIDADLPKMTATDTANALLYTLNQFAQKSGADFTIDSLSNGYEKMLNETVERMAAFKETLKDEDFKLAFQPIVDLKSGLIHHYEVLVRLDKQDTFSNPFDFISFGEQSGIIGDFDLLMCQKVFDVLIRTARKGNYPMVAVNLSGRSIGSFIFKDALRKLLELNKKVRKQVIFEVTESAKIEDMVAANEFLQELRRAGNLCCLDDFGTGESSFDYLRNLQVDFIKIDGSYVRESLKSQRGRHMLKAMSGLCRDLNVTTIGEMVEDEKGAAMLWEAGVKFGQGYLFGKPDVDEETIVNCKKPTPFYQGIMRAKKIHNNKRAWWASEH